MASATPSASGTSKTSKWIAPSRGGYSAKPSRLQPTKKLTPPKSPASSSKKDKKPE